MSLNATKSGQRQALPVGAGIGGKNCQTPNPPLGLNPRKTRTPSYAMLGSLSGFKFIEYFHSRFYSILGLNLFS